MNAETVRTVLILAAVSIGAIVAVVLLVVYKFLHPKHAVVRTFTPKTAFVRCHYCGKGIHSCFHQNGVPSTWEHDDGFHFCNGGEGPTEAWHA